MSELSNPKHEAFAREVGLFGSDHEQAYRLHVARPGSLASARNGARLLLRPEIAARIKELSAVAMDKAAELAGVDRARALAEQARIAYSNLQDYAGLLLAQDASKAGDELKALPRDKAAAIQAISWDSNGRIRIKLHDKVGALAALLRATEGPAYDPAPAEKPEAPAYEAEDDWMRLTKRDQGSPRSH